MTAHHDITLADLEQQFGTSEGKVRFPRFCNAAIVVEAKGPLATLPRLDDSPGQDGGFDGSWTVRDDALAVNAHPFARPGWNAFQYKSLGSNSPANEAFLRLKQSVRRAAQKLISRTSRPGELQQYTLFTNLNLGRVEASSTANGAILRSRRDELIAAIREGLPSTEVVDVVIVSAAELQAIVNQRPALRETFFGDRLFDTWEQAWSKMALQPNTQPNIPLVGRARLLEQLKTALADPVIRFIGLPGASGMGKSRIGLEATRDIAPQACFVRLGSKAQFLAKDLAAYAGASRTIFVIEDLRPDEAKSLAQQAALHPGFCILASIPTEEHLPRFGLVESPAIKSLRLPPLDSNESRELLKAAQAKLDSDAFDWVLQEAGGNPQILLVAAAFGPDLRRQVGQLRRSVAENFLRKAKALFGDEVESVLELLSVLSPFNTKSDAQIDAVRSVFELTAGASSIRHYKDRLIDAAFAESSGKNGRELNVSPPLLAAYLLERVLDGTSDRLLELYQKLNEDGRARLFDRLISIDGSTGHGLWTHVFGASGPFVGLRGLEDNQASLRILSRAAPRQTAEFLQSRVCDITVLLGRKKKRTSESLAALLADKGGHHQHNRLIDKFRWDIISVFRELIDHPDSSRIALKIVEQIATQEPTIEESFSKLFTECFIPWIYDFPVPPGERWEIIDRLIKSEKRSVQKLGYEALFIITNPPHNKSGQVVQRRRLGEHSVLLTWNEVWDHHVTAFERHLTTATKPGAFRARANERFPGALSNLETRLPPAQVMPLLHRVERAIWQKKLDLPPAKFLGLLIRTRERFDKIWRIHSAAAWASAVPEYSRDLDRMLRRIEQAPFAVRLAIWLDRQPTFGWERVDGTKRHRYEVELEKLALEVTATPRKLTTKLLEQLTGDGYFHGTEFARCMGQADFPKHFWKKFASLQAQTSGAWVFGSYCEGVSKHDADFVDRTLEEAMPKAGANMLPILKILGPTPTNRRRLLDLVERKKVTSSELARIFMGGRWLDDVPTHEVKTLISYIANDNSRAVTYELLQVLSLYIHPEKKIPLSLLPIAEAVLLRPAAQHQDTGYDADNLAEAILNSSPSKGFRLFQSLLQKNASADWETRGWNPLSGTMGSTDFFHRIRAAKPAATYRLLFEYLAPRDRMDVLDHGASPFDLTNHSAILLKLTKKNPANALTAANYLRVQQPSFWPFVFGVLEQHPSDEKVRNTLSDVILDHWRWGHMTDNSPSAGLKVIDQQLAQPALQIRNRVFLEQVRAELSKSAGCDTDDFEE